LFTIWLFINDVIAKEYKFESGYVSMKLPKYAYVLIHSVSKMHQL